MLCEYPRCFSIWFVYDGGKMKQYDTVSFIRELIIEETKYLRHYPALVVINIDSENQGRVLVTCDELGWFLPDQGVWAVPRDKHSMSVPNVGEYVEIYFMAGDPVRACYLGKCNELFQQLPTTFDGKPTSHVLFESPLMKKGIKFDDLTGKMVIDFITAEIGAGATEAMVLGTALKTQLEALCDGIVALTVTCAAPGSPSSPPINAATFTAIKAQLTTILSLLVKVK